MTISGTIEKIIFQNEENGWCVALLQTTERCEKLTGYMPGIRVGTNVTVNGQHDRNQYGKYFAVESWNEDLPITAEGILRYLSDTEISGMGKVLAARIVDTFGTHTFDILNNEPQRLLNIQGIGETRLAAIKSGWMEHRYLAKIISTLTSYGVSANYAFRIYKVYGDRSVEVLQTDPYCLIDDIDGIGFKIADRIAVSIGIPRDSYSRIKSALVFTLKDAAKKGDCYCEEDTLIEQSAKLLELPEAMVAETLSETVEREVLIQEDDHIYLPVYYYTEKKVAARLVALMDTRCPRTKPNFFGVDIEYEKTQRMAIEQALNNPAFFITGGPGTGKTTIIRAIINSLRRGEKILLAAPTGRAAKRLSEATGRDACTIHRLLGANFDGFKKDEDDPLDGDVLIVDECSMIDLMLMNALLKAVPGGMRVIFVGDADQLPSVGPGSVLRDIIESRVIPGVRLTHIFRQAEKSRIITNSHKIINGEYPDLSNGKDTNFAFLPACETDEETAQLIVETRQKFCGDAQVLSPSKIGPCGTVALNRLLQDALNPGKPGMKCGSCSYREGDRVMQTRNDYNKDVFNGDVGVILRINDDNTLYVDFDDKIEHVLYTKNEASDDLMLAYAATIHKAQGSEYDVVIIPLLDSCPYMLKNRNLFYTGVTRAKQLCVLIASKKAISRAVWRQGACARKTTLCERLRECISVGYGWA